jgi:drug/metabolite transporter (DMT)-like permease
VAAFPLVVLMLAFVIFGEKITLWNVMGSVFIVVGIFLLKY